MSAKRVIGAATVGLAAVALIAPLVVPLPTLKDTVPPEDLADLDSRFLDAEVTGVRLRVHYKVAGSDGPALVLLHGFGASLFTWHDVIGPLGEVGRVVAYDRPAFGLTSRPLPGQWTGPSPYGPAAQVELLVSLLGQLGVDRAVLVGSSAGGTVALQAALRRPELVEALILVDPAVYVGGGPSWLRAIFSTPQMQRLGPLLVRSLLTRLDATEIGLAWHDSSGVTKAVLDGYRAPLKTRDWDRALWELVKATSSPRLGERLGEVHTPTLVITGDDDQIVPTQESVRLARELPNARLVVIPNCGHLPQEECPGSFLDAVREFVAEIGRSTGK